MINFKNQSDLLQLFQEANIDLSSLTELTMKQSETYGSTIKVILLSSAL